jgi:hypothetical protein
MRETDRNDAALDLSGARSESRRAAFRLLDGRVGTAAITAPFQCSPL